MKRIYICHPYGADPVLNASICVALARAIVDEGHQPIVPQIYLSQLIDDETERDLALRLGLDLVTLCDELRVYGDVISSGMAPEIALAEKSNIPVTRHPYPVGLVPRDSFESMKQALNRASRAIWQYREALGLPMP